MLVVEVVRSSVLAVALSVASPVCARAPYRAPVAAPVVAGFSLPFGPYGPGNRGLEYRTAIGQPVRVVGAGRVLFAGLVAGQMAVSVAHADGLVSSYSYLSGVVVDRGDTVAAGQLLGTATYRFQLGFRRNGLYLDPAPYLGASLRPRLVGADVAPPGAACPVCRPGSSRCE